MTEDEMTENKYQRPKEDKRDYFVGEALIGPIESNKSEQKTTWHLYPETKQIFIFITLDEQKLTHEAEQEMGAYQLENGDIFANIDYVIEIGFPDSLEGEFHKKMKQEIITNHENGRLCEGGEGVVCALSLTNDKNRGMRAEMETVKCTLSLPKDKTEEKDEMTENKYQRPKEDKTPCVVGESLIGTKTPSKTIWHLYPETKQVFISAKMDDSGTRELTQLDEQEMGAYQLENGETFINIDYMIEKAPPGTIGEAFFKKIKYEIIANHENGRLCEGGEDLKCTLSLPKDKTEEKE